MIYRILATLTLSFVVYLGSSQDSFHRLYETSMQDPMTMTDTLFHHMASTTNNSGDVFAVGTKRVGDINDYEDFSIVFVKLSNKGDIDWQRELDFGKDSVEIKGICDFAFNGAQDSLLFVVDIVVNDTDKEVFGKVAPSGAGLELNNVGGYQVVETINLPKVAPFVNSSDLLLTPALQPIISRVGPNQDLLWSQAYEFVNTDGDSLLNLWTDINSTADSTIVVVGLGSVTGEQFVVAELDSNGVQLWAEAVTFPITNFTNATPHEIIPLEDGSVAVVGNYSTVGPLDTRSFVMVLDSMGNVILSKSLEVNGISSGALNIHQAADGNLWIAGISEVNDTSTYYLTSMDLDGMINWTSYYPEQEPGASLFSTSLIDVPPTGGATFIGHGFKDEQAVMHVMKHNADGMTPCSDTITTIALDLAFTTDTLTAQTKEGGIFFDTLAYDFKGFGGLTPPILSIVPQYQPFCPNEPIDTFIVATVSRVDEANVTYLWSTGEVTDTIRVTDEGMYSVTVTISQDVCFTMCDTTEITRHTLPGVDITVDNSRFCVDDVILLTGNFVPGALDPTYLWSTGETTQTIEVMTEGEYSVTVTDNCGEMASDVLNVSFPDITPTVTISQGECQNFASTLIAEYEGLGVNPDFVWSTGDSTATIFVTDEGEYSVTVTDECDEVISSSFSFEPSSEITTSFSGINTASFCVNNGVQINATAQSSAAGDLLFEWSTGEVDISDSQSSIIVTENGEYQVTITDACGTSVLLTENVTVPVPPTTGEITFDVDCETKRVTINRIPNDNPVFPLLDIVDLTNGSNSATGVVESGQLELHNYFVELKACDEVLDSLTINASIACGVFEYPIVFFPSGDDPDSKRFGPIPTDSMDYNRVSNVDFKVFNRWGELVHETTDIQDSWDGTHKGDPAPSEVYIWYVTYIVEGQQMLDKGDVTLVR